MERVPVDYLNGFWLNKTTFIKADDVQVEEVERKNLVTGKPIQKPIVVFHNVTQLTCNPHGKMVNVERYKKLAVWLNTLKNPLTPHRRILFR